MENIFRDATSAEIDEDADDTRSVFWYVMVDFQGALAR
jgi:hypothetical protein